MDRVAVFVDAGYLFAQGATALCGEKLPRGQLLLDAGQALASLQALATSLTGLPLLRTYWYDGTSTGPTNQHLTLAHLSGVKMRLGFVNSVGEQKGVDSLIVTDMINLARNRAMADAVLLSGDEDLRVGVQQAQEFGVRVHLLGIRPSRGSQSLFLLQEADTTHEWGPDDLVPFLSVKASTDRSPDASALEPSSNAAADVASIDQLERIAKELAADVAEKDLVSLVESGRRLVRIPPEYDGRLLATSRARLGAALNTEQKRRVRKLFIDACADRLPNQGN